MSHPETIRMLAEVVQKNSQQKSMQIRLTNQCTELKKTEGCCGGYCGNYFWQKLFFSKKVLHLDNRQNFNVGEQLVIILPLHYSIIFQSSLWLLNSLIFILLLTILPNTLISLLIGLVGTVIAFISIFNFLQYLQLTPLSLIEIRRKN